MSQWLVTTKDIAMVVEAESQFEAYAAIQREPLKNYGLIVEATPLGDGAPQDSYAIRTSLLFHHWALVAETDDEVAGFVMLSMFAHKAAEEVLGPLTPAEREALPEWNEPAWLALDEPYGGLSAFGGKP